MDVFLENPVKVNTFPEEVPENGFQLFQNYPNPFNSGTSITYTISQGSQVRFIIYDLLGQKVADLVDSVQMPGTYNITFNSRHLSSGLYFYQLKVNELLLTRKMLLTN